MQLYEAPSTHVAEWRDAGYQHEEFPAIAEILEWVSNPDVPNFLCWLLQSSARLREVLIWLEPNPFLSFGMYF